MSPVDLAEDRTDMSDIVERLRRHEHRLLNEEATMRLGYGVATEKEDRWDMGHSLDDAANEIERLRAQLDLRDRQYAELQSDFTALQKAVVGETGQSAILEATRLRAQRDKAMAALREIENYAEGLEYTHSAVYEIARRALAELEAGGQEVVMSNPSASTSHEVWDQRHKQSQEGLSGGQTNDDG